MNDPMSKALEQSLAEACDAVGMRPDDEACPDCYIAGSIEAFRRQHEAERDERAALRARLAALTVALEGLVRMWRAMAASAFEEGAIPGDDGHTSRWTAVEFCADELDRLAALQTPEATP